MLARDLAQPYPAVALDTDAFVAARLVAEDGLAALIILGDGERRPHSILPASQVVRWLVPRYVQEDPSLARVYDERHADELARRLQGRRVIEMLPADAQELAVVEPDATAVEVAALMARVRTPLAVVMDGGRMTGAITASHLLGRLLPSA